ncbi:MAG: DUF4089 domain-containing protein [Synechococcales cyanobacterium CRU_2_2]|nr:DUF4089 domain-containing protein [Synechococcales cyanobacterium CRU_2_2]
MSHPEGPESTESLALCLELVQALAQQLDLQLPPESVAAVGQNWLMLAALAGPLLTWELPPSLDPAPRFEP